MTEVTEGYEIACKKALELLPGLDTFFLSLHISG